MQFIRQNQTDTRAKILFNLLNEIGYQKITDFQTAHHLEVDGLFGRDSYSALYNRLLKVVDIRGDFEGAYYRQAFPKQQIVLHHSAGWDNARLMFQIWKYDKLFHVATSVGVSDGGTLVRGYDEEFWAYHIGLGNPILEQGSIGIEICNWGALEERASQLYTWVNDYGKRGTGTTLSHTKAIELNYKGYRFYESYTDAEINVVKYWTLLNAMRFGIPLKYSEKDMWQVSNNALSGKPGLYSHNSFISWKTDISPQPKIIAMLKDLKEYEK